MPHTGEGAPVVAGTPSTPNQQRQPGPSATKTKALVHRTTIPAIPNALGSRRTAPRFPVRTSDAAAVALFTLVVGTVLIAACVVLTLGWPS